MSKRSEILKNGPIFLVEPPINPVSERTGLAAIARYPALAQARLAGQIPDGKVEIFDLRIAREVPRFLKRLAEAPPALVGISTTFSSNGEEASWIAREVRTRSPESVIVLGGSAPSEEPMAFFPAEVDFIGFRAGDGSLPSLVAALRRDGSVPDKPSGFFYRGEGKWELGPAQPPIEMHDLQPYAWHLFPKHYWRNYFQAFRITGMSHLSQGCPYDCNFCSVWITHGRRIELAGLENVKHDFESLPPFARGFFFADDIWMQGTEKQLSTLYDPLLKWLSSEYFKKRDDLTLTAETRTDLFLRQIERFKAWTTDGRLQRVFFGVEAVTDEALKGFSKRNTIDHNSEAIRTAAEMGLHVSVQLVIPLDADHAYFDEVEKFWKEHEAWIRTMSATVATPLPGTVLYNDLIKTYPDLGDRSVIRHPGFSLYTALVPTRLDTEVFYERLARVFQVTKPSKIYKTRARGTLWNLVRFPWIIPKLARSMKHVRGLTKKETYLDMHRYSQGERLLSKPALSV